MLPVVEALSPHVRVSIDTRKAEVAEAAIAAGATLVNDVSASLHEVAAAAGPCVGFVAMHMLGDPRTMQANPTYDDVVREVRAFLVARADAAVAAGVEEVDRSRHRVRQDHRHNLSLLKHLDVLVSTGFPVVVGTSRKRFLGALLADADRPKPLQPVAVDDRIEGSVASAVWAMVQGVRMVRVHDVRATVHAARVVAG